MLKAFHLSHFISNLALVKENVLGSSSQKSASSRWVKVPGGGSISATRALISSLTRDRDLMIMIINNKTKYFRLNLSDEE